jgi:predicted ABC-type transport system involved in lysophospholipase L1 biosynthesis ATPase subunit
MHHLLPQCTVFENVLVPTLAGRDLGSASDVRERAGALLARVGLADRMSHRPGELSGGQRQRVAVARALINKPRLLLADEPTGSLDEGASQSIAELLVQLNRDDGVTLAVVTHSRELASRIGPVLELSGGVLNDKGRP